MADMSGCVGGHSAASTLPGDSWTPHSYLVIRWIHSPRSRLKLKTNSTHSDSIGDSLGQKMFNSQLEIVPNKKLSHSFTSNYLETWTWLNSLQLQLWLMLIGTLQSQCSVGFHHQHSLSPHTLPTLAGCETYRWVKLRNSRPRPSRPPNC